MCKTLCDAGGGFRLGGGGVSTRQRMFVRLAWSAGCGGSSSKSLVRRVTKYSVSSDLFPGSCRVLALFMAIHNLVRSWLCVPGSGGSWRATVSYLCRRSLLSETGTCRAS